MKSKLLLAVIAALALTGCERKNAAIQNELLLIEKTAKDSTQPDYIRESATTFGKILRGENNVSVDDWIVAHGEMVALRNKTTISTYVAFLKSLEKNLPEKLPSAEQYELLEKRSNNSKTVESNIAWTIIMMGESIKEMSLYGDPDADEEISAVLKRFKDKHGASETGKKILEFLNMVHEQGMTARSWGIKPWESPRGGGGNID